MSTWERNSCPHFEERDTALITLPVAAPRETFVGCGECMMELVARAAYALRRLPRAAPERVRNDVIPRRRWRPGDDISILPLSDTEGT